jgi:hypothetical protein
MAQRFLGIKCAELMTSCRDFWVFADFFEASASSRRLIGLISTLLSATTEMRKLEMGAVKNLQHKVQF